MVEKDTDGAAGNASEDEDEEDSIAAAAADDDDDDDDDDNSAFEGDAVEGELIGACDATRFQSAVSPNCAVLP